MTWPQAFSHLVDDIFSWPVYLLVVIWVIRSTVVSIIIAASVGEASNGRR